MAHGASLWLSHCASLDGMGALDGKAAVVTGGSRGIGRAVVERLARDGAEVVFSYLSNDMAAGEVETAARAMGGRAEALQADVGRLEDVRGLFDEADKRLGGLDILINNAGIAVITSLAEAREERSRQGAGPPGHHS
jgi:3-oxoacyl-[acyl-carrier protein] reductase